MPISAAYHLIMSSMLSMGVYILGDTLMKQNSYHFIKGIIGGAFIALILGGLGLYTLNVLGYAIIQLPVDWGISILLNFTYDNLKLSIVPFIIVLVAFVLLLNKLSRQLEDSQCSIDQIGQTDHLIDTSISLFFGIGVIWTAIGMRSALLFALGDPESAAVDGAFAMLQRMVDGGILLALSTTIFGGIGGYLMRMVKTLYLGQRLQYYFNAHMQKQGEGAFKVLQQIEAHLQQLTADKESVS